MAVLTESPVVGGVSGSEAKINVRTSAAATVKIEYATNNNFNNSTITSCIDTVSSSDFTATFKLIGLAVDQRYWYRVLVDGIIQNTGYTQRFDTFPTGTETFSFAVFADVGNTDKVAVAYKNAKLDGVLFALQIGDFNHGNPTTLSAARQMHREMRDPSKNHGGHFTKQITSKMSVGHVWDDHDYGGNDEDKNFAGRADALQAFAEYYPNHDSPNSAGIWHSFVCGDAEFFMLDLRSQRDPNSYTDNSGKSMLDGNVIEDDQKYWLKVGLLNSTKTWKFIISSVTFNDDARPASDDLWRSFGTEMNELKDYIADSEIDNVIVLDADIHTGGGIDDGTNSGIGVPEMTVPHTNLTKGNSNNLGTWSEGVTSGRNGKGYGFVTVSSTGVTLLAKAQNGNTRHSYSL